MREALIASNVELVRQGAELLAGMEHRRFTEADATGAIVGHHMRHVIDFYHSFLRDAPGGVVDYDDRPRDPRLETDVEHARQALQELSSTLRAVRDLPESGLQVKCDTPDVPDLLGASSVERELQVLASHTLHHFALISVSLRLSGLEVPETFGVAPSTLRFWKDRKTRAS